MKHVLFKTFRFFAAHMLFALCVYGADISTDEQPAPVDYREEMRRFVISVSEYGKKRNNNFIVIPQNGLELITDDGSVTDSLQQRYLSAITAVGQESLFYGYAKDDKPTPSDVRAYTLKLCRLYKQNGIPVLVTDYCSSPKKVGASYALNAENGFISFAADKRNLTDIPRYPRAPYNSNTHTITRLSDAANFLYLINGERFSSKRAFIDAVKNTDYDVIIMDLFHFELPYTAAEINELKTKRRGGKRLVICYMSIGEAENYRYYWQEHWRTDKPDWLMEENPLWKGNYIVKYWISDWQQIITGNGASYQQKIIDAGFDGVYLDIIDAFEYFENELP